MNKKTTVTELDGDDALFHLAHQLRGHGTQDLLLKFYEALVSDRGEINWPEMSRNYHSLQEGLKTLTDMGLVELRSIEDLRKNVWGQKTYKENTTHIVVFTPEAWNLAERFRRKDASCHFLDLPSIHYKHKIESTGLIHKHPSYGVIRVTRSQGGNCTLFGSSIEHDTRMTVEIGGAELHRDHNEFRVHGTGDHKIHIEMSAAQWAAFISGIGNGDGTPCTITYEQEHGKVPSPPSVRMRDTHHLELREMTSDMGKGLQDAIHKAEEKIKAGGVKKSDFKELIEGFHQVARTLTDSLPFAQKQFEEAADKVVAACEMEIDAKLALVASTIGYKVLGGATAKEAIAEVTRKPDPAPWPTLEECAKEDGDLPGDEDDETGHGGSPGEGVNG